MHLSFPKILFLPLFFLSFRGKWLTIHYKSIQIYNLYSFFCLLAQRYLWKVQLRNRNYTLEEFLTFRKFCYDKLSSSSSQLFLELHFHVILFKESNKFGGFSNKNVLIFLQKTCCFLASLILNSWIVQKPKSPSFRTVRMAPLWRLGYKNLGKFASPVLQKPTLQGVKQWEYQHRWEQLPVRLWQFSDKTDFLLKN